MLLAAAIFALVLQDDTSLRASPSRSAPSNAVLWQGDALEVRGARAGYLQVWDYRRERGGYVLETQVRPYPLAAESAAGLLENVRLLREMHGFEALGIGHAALFLKAAPPAAIGAEVFDALGTMADRLARRASSRSSRAPGDPLAAHLDVVQGYGITLATVDVEGHVRLCYDGDAFRRVLDLDPTPEQRARAALALTRPACDVGTAAQRYAAHERAAALLEGVPLDALPAGLRDRVRLRRAATWSTLAFEHARAGKSADSHAAGARGQRELMLVSRAELAETDVDTHSEAALRAAVARSAVEVGGAASAPLVLHRTPGASGETCLRLAAVETPQATLFERCTYGVVWPESVRVAPRGDALALAVQPMEGWRELWVFHRVDGAWRVDVIAPASEPGLGYIEWAGWTPDGRRMLAARETRSGAGFVRSFELLDLKTLAVERKAARPRDLTPFHRWQAPEWKGQTLALR